jgi:hypothetical protein
MALSRYDFRFRDSEDIEEITELDFEHLVLDEEETVPVRLFADRSPRLRHT